MQTKRKLNFILCSKGGVGKSMLTLLFALVKENDEHSVFIDLDNSTQTSTKQLKFLGSNRTETVSLLNDKEVLVRDNLISYLESLVSSPFNEFFFDLGSPESEQMPALLDRDIPFKEFLDELGFEAHFHVVVGGGGAYKPCIEYLQKLLKSLHGQFDITVWKNITSFNNFQALGNELKQICHDLAIRFRQFGDFDPSSHLGNQILDGIRLGNGFNDYQTGARLRIKKELNTNFKNELNIV